MSKLTRAIEELARRADAGDVKAAEGIKAYHGSPYSFDKFSTSQIGTGEGAQAYSRGLYFAEREKTAEGYRDRIAGADWVDSSGIPQQTNSITSDLTERLRADGMGVVDADRAATMWSIIARDGDQARNSPGYPVIKKYLDEKGIKLRQKGSMYEVNIDATPDEFIDWDLPLDEQSESVMNALKKTDWYEYAEEGAYNAAERRGDNAYGMDLVRWLEEDGAEDAAQMLKDAGIKGVQYADAQTRFGKGPKTKNYVVYDDKLIDITKKYGISVPLASAVAAGTMTPEEAQAGALSAGARRIIDPRFSQPVAGGSTRKGVLTDLEGMETTVDPRLMNIGRSEALYDYEGSPYILTQSDRSAAGGVVTSVKGKEIDPVNLRGGRDFMFDPQSGDLVWASDPAVVKSMYKRALELREKYKKDPLLLPYTMAPTGIDFATMPLDVMINYARQGMGRSDIKRLDEQIRKVIPSWKGVMNPEANAVFREVHGNKRKAVANIIDKQFRDVEGGLSMGEARAATSDAAQYMAPDGSIQNIGQIEISDSSSIDQLSDHPTYRGGLKGQGIGKLDVDIDARELMEDKGRELTGDAADIRALSMNHELSQGVVDEKLLRRLYDKQRPRIEAISKKFGVSIPIAAMALMGEPEEAQAGPISSGIKRLASAYEKVTSPQAEGVARMVEQGQISPEQADKYTNTIKAYKLFRTKGGNTDELFPLFVNANKPVRMGEWNPAESGSLTDAGKVKSSIGPLAYRPGWHAGDAPVATHIGGKSDSSLKAPDYRPADQVWAEVEMPADVDWQSVADSRMEYSKAGKPIPRTAQITDQIPEGGYYRYKTNPNMTGDWLIAGDMKVNRVLTPSEVYQINAERGVHDLPPVDENGKMLWSLALGSGLTAAGIAPEEAKAELLSEVPQEQAQQLQDNWSQIEANAQAGMGGMGVRSAPVTQDEEAIIAAQPPAPTGADLMQQANDDFLSNIVNQPEPDFLSDVQQSLLSGIMKTAGIADLSADIASAMFAPVMSAPGAVARYATGSTADEIAQARRETEDYFNYQPRTELGPQYGEQAMQAIGGAVSPYIPAIKEAAGESYILGAMKQGYDYLGEREKELAKALMDLSPY